MRVDALRCTGRVPFQGWGGEPMGLEVSAPPSAPAPLGVPSLWRKHILVQS